MDIYYNATTFTLATQLIILEDNGKETIKIVNNSPDAVARCIHHILDTTKSTRIIVHIRGEKFINQHFIKFFAGHKRIEIREF